MFNLFYYRRINLCTGLIFCVPLITRDNETESKRRIDLWNASEEGRQGGRHFEYAFVPNSCVKKLFGSIGWTSSQEWPK